MRRIEVSMIVALAFSLAFFEPACVLSGKVKSSAAAAPPPPKPATQPAPAQPSEPLSVPQTQVQLPPAQPINPDALATEPKPEEPATAPTASRAPRHTAPAQPKPAETQTPSTPTPPPVTAAPAEELPPVQEVLSPEDRKRLQESADNRQNEIRQLLSQLKGHRLSAEQNREVKRIQSFVEQAENAEKRGDMRQADALAERALILAQEMTGGK
jgi:hypothetical protein